MNEGSHPCGPSPPLSYVTVSVSLITWYLSVSQCLSVSSPCIFGSLSSISFFVFFSLSLCLILSMCLLGTLHFSGFPSFHHLLSLVCLLCFSSRSERLGHREVFPFGECPASGPGGSRLSLGVDLTTYHPGSLGKVLPGPGKVCGWGSRVRTQNQQGAWSFCTQSGCRPSTCGQRMGLPLAQPRMVSGAGTDHHPGLPGAAHRRAGRA